MAAELLQFLDTQAAPLTDDGQWLGTSDIIESVFGKYKRFSQRASVKGIGKMVLTIPAFTGRMDMQEVGAAVEEVRCVDVAKWAKDNLGVSLFAKRRSALAPTAKSKTAVNLSAELPKEAAGF